MATVKRFVVLVGVVAAGLGAMLRMREPTTRIWRSGDLVIW